MFDLKALIISLAASLILFSGGFALSRYSDSFGTSFYGLQWLEHLFIGSIFGAKFEEKTDPHAWLALPNSTWAFKLTIAINYFILAFLIYLLIIIRID